MAVAGEAGEEVAGEGEEVAGESEEVVDGEDGDAPLVLPVVGGRAAEGEDPHAGLEGHEFEEEGAGVGAEGVG